MERVVCQECGNCREMPRVGSSWVCADCGGRLVCAHGAERLKLIRREAARQDLAPYPHISESVPREEFERVRRELEERGVLERSAGGARM